MRLTTFTDYSLRVLMFVATAPEGRATIAEIARSFGISEHHLVKVVHALGKAGLLENTRGRGGGLRLAMPAASIRVGQVVRAAEGGDVPAECFERDSNGCAIVRVCRLKNVLAEAVQAFYKALDRYTIADLVSNRTKLAAILHFHTAPAHA
jgi:Rrf2 family transcriptional regulator, nitric oxide-sensitive transcriptional repressor